ncbi:MAG: Asp-tRNA(Asn)/Glu-tRNA(Gln) amidotransferase subunit GatC [Planctomycetaceae bacterium]
MSEPLNVAEVQKVARLPRMKLSAADVAKFSQQLGDVLGYIHQLNEVPTDGIEPMVHAVEIENVRADELRPSLPRAEAQERPGRTASISSCRRFWITRHDNRVDLREHCVKGVPRVWSRAVVSRPDYATRDGRVGRVSGRGSCGRSATGRSRRSSERPGSRSGSWPVCRSR